MNSVVIVGADEYSFSVLCFRDGRLEWSGALPMLMSVYINIKPGEVYV
jgi:hypothetical protein